MESYSILDRILPWRVRAQEAQLLALQVEKAARKLNGLAPAQQDGGRGELIDILKSACLLLERLEAHPRETGAALEDSAAAITENTTDTAKDSSTSAAGPTITDDSSPINDAIYEQAAVLEESTLSSSSMQPGEAAGTAAAQDQAVGEWVGLEYHWEAAANGSELPSDPASPGPPAANASIAASADPTPGADPAAGMSGAAKELIKLRDWVLLQINSQKMPAPEFLKEMYLAMGKILAREGIESLEDEGPFDHQRQQVIDTQFTNNPEMDEWICSTLRPGYLHQGKLIRPQEVVVFTFEET